MTTAPQTAAPALPHVQIGAVPDTPPLGAPGGGLPVAVGRIQQRHHTVARLVALGESTAAIAQVTGYSPGHINNLQKDPAFQGLLAGWAAQVKRSYDGMALKIADAAAGSVDEYQRRLEFTPEDITTGELLKGAEIFLDRAGYGKSSEVTVKADIRGSIVSQLVAEEEVLLEPHTQRGVEEANICGEPGGGSEGPSGGEAEGDTL